MVENVLILLLFLGALAYLGNLARRVFSPKCCGTCAVAEATKKLDVPA